MRPIKPEVMIAEQFDTFLVDLDGVVYLGDSPLLGATGAIARLRERDKQIRFFTNDPRPTREDIATRLREMGIQAEVNEVVSSGWATAQYLREQDDSMTVDIVGSGGLKTELRNAGVVFDETDPTVMVVGADEQTSYTDIRRAARRIHEGAEFVATNTDGSFPTSEGPAPGAGAIVGAVEAASGVRPTVIGKPEPWMFEIALGTQFAESRTVVIGDSPRTDILGAHRAGITGILVANQNQGWKGASAHDFRIPDACITDLSELFDSDRTVDRWKSPPYQWPDEIHPGVAAIVLSSDNEVLLVKRADRDVWALPTGTMERCETIHEAVIREINEETGLTVAPVRMSGIYSDPETQAFSYPSGRVVHFVTSCLVCEVGGGELQADEDEAVAVEFFARKNLPAEVLWMHPQWIEDAFREEDTPVIR